MVDVMQLRTTDDVSNSTSSSELEKEFHGSRGRILSVATQRAEQEAFCCTMWATTALYATCTKYYYAEDAFRKITRE